MKHSIKMRLLNFPRKSSSENRTHSSKSTLGLDYNPHFETDCQSFLKLWLYLILLQCTPWFILIFFHYLIASHYQVHFTCLPQKYDYFSQRHSWLAEKTSETNVEVRVGNTVKISWNETMLQPLKIMLRHGIRDLND